MGCGRSARLLADTARGSSYLPSQRSATSASKSARAKQLACWAQTGPARAPPCGRSRVQNRKRVPIASIHGTFLPPRTCFSGHIFTNKQCFRKLLTIWGQPRRRGLSFSMRRYREVTMPRLEFISTTERLASQTTADPLWLATLVRCLVGHTVEEVERELILCSLSHYCGNRTCAAKMLGISVRTMRNKISEYAAQGRFVPAPGQSHMSTSITLPVFLSESSTERA
jgi:hypothetical protein